MDDFDDPDEGRAVAVFSPRGVAVAAIAVTVVLAGCSSVEPASDAPPPSEVNPFARCKPITDEQIRQAAEADTLTAHLAPPVCTWNATRVAGDSELTFTFTEVDSLQQLWDRARQAGYETEHLTVIREALGTTITATGFYVRNPRDPGHCEVSAAVNGSITWRVRNLSQPTTPDPCAVALELATLTINLAP
ncbi:DUF3558 family protein [Nocardia barduliensis]|uniref:DUF3558 family protein n=1 Tax=Nocardia barduliensis TaxID=2736643 RepID=UPI00157457F3|nr:DUF3558 family protein [Nocardia barduliensis]